MSSSLFFSHHHHQLLSVSLLLLISLLVGVVCSTNAQTTSPEEGGHLSSVVAPLNFKFVADIEVTYPEPTNSNLIKSVSARVFGNPEMEGAWPCVILTSNRTEIAMPMDLTIDIARVQICGQPHAHNIPFSQLDTEFQVLGRICSVMKWPQKWSSPLRRQQLAGVPVYTGEATCYPVPSESCACTCRYAFDEPEWVGEARQALRAEEITGCPSTCNFPRNTFVSVMSMVRVKMTPEMIIGDCDNANEGQAGGVGTGSSQSNPNGVSWNTNNNQHMDGTVITYNFGAPTDFPSLPQRFAANFKVSLLEYGVSIEYMTIYNAFARAARTTVFNVDTVDGSMEFARGETYLTQGLSQITYRIEHDTVHGDASSDYTYSDSCERMVYNDDIFASSVHRLLMVPAAAPPVFAGRYTVRGVPCDLWTQAVDVNLKVDWYFPVTANTSVVGNSNNNNNNVNNNERLPRRIVLRGTGRSPFFVHHPFIPQTVKLGVQDTTYCDRKPFFFDPHCTGDELPSNLNYQHVIDIAELPAFLSQNTSRLFTPPPACSGATTYSTSCNSNGVNGAIVFLLGLVCLGLGVLSARSFCPGNVEAKKEDDDEFRNQNNTNGNDENNNNMSASRFNTNNSNNNTTTTVEPTSYSPKEGREEMEAGDDTPARPF